MFAFSFFGWWSRECAEAAACGHLPPTPPVRACVAFFFFLDKPFGARHTPGAKQKRQREKRDASVVSWDEQKQFQRTCSFFSFSAAALFLNSGGLRFCFPPPDFALVGSLHGVLFFWFSCAKSATKLETNKEDATKQHLVITPSFSPPDCFFFSTLRFAPRVFVCAVSLSLSIHICARICCHQQAPQQQLRVCPKRGFLCF